MKKYIALFVLRIRLTLLFLPRALCGTVLFTVLLCAGAAGINITAADSDGEMEKLKIAVCLLQDEGQKDESRYIKMAVDYASNTDSVKELGEFEYCYDESEATEKLMEGRYAAVAVIPSGFINKIMSGNGEPARIIFAGEGPNVSSALFQEMIEAGVSDIGSAQIGVYAVGDMLREYFDGMINIYQAENELNMEYFSYALDRNVYFSIEYVTEKKVMSVVQSFVCIGIMVIIAVSGILCYQCLCPDEHGFKEMLVQRHISPVLSFFIRVLAASVVMAVIYSLIYFIVCISSMRYPQVSQIITAVSGFSEYTPDGLWQAVQNILKGQICIFAALFIGHAATGVVYLASDGNERTGDGFLGIIILCIVYFIMFFMSGCIIESSMLPEWVSRLGDLLPTSWMHELVKEMLVG